MTTQNLSITSALLIAFALSTAQADSLKAGRMTVAGEAKETLQEIDASAFTVAEEAGQLRQFSANPQYGPEAHLDKLIAMKEEINRIGREIGSLEAERDALAPWEQQAIDKTLPLLKETAANTQNAIEYFNENRAHLWTVNYREYASVIWRDSEQIAKTLKDYLKYAKARDQEQQLEQRLGVAGS